MSTSSAAKKPTASGVALDDVVVSEVNPDR